MPVIPAKPGSTKGLWFRPRQTKKDPISKITNIKRAVGVVQVVKCLPDKHKALSSTPTPAQYYPSLEEFRLWAPGFWDHFYQTVAVFNKSHPSSLSKDLIS
jgi:hypothetical protein